MYRDKIREQYNNLSRSYRRVADYILSNYYDVSFMTAAQLAVVVDVDTTTVVRFSQRIGYNGYPELLTDIREQVRAEIYSAYSPKQFAQGNRAALFRMAVEQERQNLSQMLIHNPQEHIDAIVEMLENAQHILIMADGYAAVAAELASTQLRHHGFSVESIPADTVLRAEALSRMADQTLLIGICATEHGHDLAKAITYARSKGCATLSIVGSLESPINRMADRVIFAPAETNGLLPSLTAIVAAISACIAVLNNDHEISQSQDEAFLAAYQFLLAAEDDIAEEEPEE